MTSIPEISVPLKAPQNNNVNLPWYNFFTSLPTALASAIGGLGTAAAKNVGTSGDAVPLLNRANTFSKAQTFDPVDLTFGASIAWDWSKGPIARLRMTDDGALAAPTGTNSKAGTWSVFIRQDDVGGRTLTLDAVYLPPSGEPIELSPDPNSLDVLTCVSDGTSIAVSLSHDHRAA
jgi:hypothetical protein